MTVTNRLVDSFTAYAVETEKLNNTLLDDVLNFLVTPYFIPLVVICFTIFSIYTHKRGKRAYHILDMLLIIGLTVLYIILLSLALNVQRSFFTTEAEFKTELFFSYFDHPDLEVSGLNLSLGDTMKEHNRNRELYEGYGVYLDVDGDDNLDLVYVKKTNEYAEGTLLNLNLKQAFEGVIDWSQADPQIYMYQVPKGFEVYQPLSNIEYVYCVAPSI